MPIWGWPMTDFGARNRPGPGVGRRPATARARPRIGSGADVTGFVPPVPGLTRDPDRLDAPDLIRDAPDLIRGVGAQKETRHA